MITLKNWYQQQPEVVYFIQTDYQGDEFMKKLVRREMSKEQWDKVVAKYSNYEIYKVITAIAVNRIVGFISKRVNKCMLLLL